MIRRIRDLLYDQGFTISGARNRLQELVQTDRQLRRDASEVAEQSVAPSEHEAMSMQPLDRLVAAGFDFSPAELASSSLHKELVEIRALLTLQA
jgi:hypothetical protein